MYSKWFAVLVASMLLLGVASAQEYAIRANRGLNLRVAPSLNADIADTVSSGSTLQVVGKLNRWLKIYRNGRDVWLADWVDYSRVESSEPTGSQPPTAPIDNCCHVDRQCQSDQQWVDGYWAYQNGQCAAPAQPAASAPANVDNCCFLDRQCQSNQEWIAGYQAFQRGQCAPPVPATGGNCCSLGWHCPTEVERAQGYWTYQINQCAGLPQTSGIALTGPVPRIEGSGRFRQHIEATLRFMKSVAPAWYNYVITGLDSIVEEPVHVEPYRDGQTTTCWAFANYRERKAAVQTCFMSWIIRHNGPAEFDQLSTAGALGHEACHIHTHEEGKYFATQDDEEELCTKMGTGAAVLIASALATGLNPNRGTKYFNKDEALNLLRQYCAEGYRSDLFCPTLQRLESIWRNVPYAVFPPGAPQW